MDHTPRPEFLGLCIASASDVSHPCQEFAIVAIAICEEKAMWRRIAAALPVWCSNGSCTGG
jgi:hypothetical protein